MDDVTNRRSEGTKGRSIDEGTWGSRLSAAAGELNISQLTSLLSNYPSYCVPYYIIVMTAANLLPLADVVLTLLLQHPRVNISEALRIICATGNVRPVGIILDVVSDIVLDDSCGINAIVSGNIELIQMLLADPRLSITSSSAWMTEAMKQSDLKIFQLILADPRFDKIDLGCVDVAIKHQRTEVLEILLNNSIIVESIPVSNTLVLCLEYDQHTIFDILLRHPRFYPTAAIRKHCIGEGKWPFFKVLVQRLEDKDVHRLLSVCVSLGLTEHVAKIHKSERIVFDGNVLRPAIIHTRKALLQTLLVAPYNISPCTEDICVVKLAIQGCVDWAATLLLKTCSCCHHSECLDMAVTRELQNTVACLTSQIYAIRLETVTKAVLGRNITIARDVLTKSRAIDHACVLRVLADSSLLGMVELICETVPLDLAWNDYALVKFASTLPTTVCLRYLLTNRQVVVDD
jgi:hypothetical protein